MVISDLQSRDDEFSQRIRNILLMSFKDQSRSWNLRIWLFQTIYNMEDKCNPAPSLTRWEQVKMVGPVVVFSIILPFTDIVTDLQLIIKLFSHGHVNYASMLLGKDSPKNPLSSLLFF